MRILQLFLSLILLTTTCFGQYLKPIRGMQFVNRTHRLSRGLVLHLPFNEGSGNTVADLSGNNYQTELRTADDTWWWWEPGIHGVSLRTFNSSTVALYWPTHGLVNSGGAIVTWINYNALIGGTQHLTGSNNSRLYIYRESARLWIRFGLSVDYDTGFDFSADTWYHLAVTWAGSGDGTAKAYINGVEIASTDYVGFTQLTTDFVFGSNFPGGAGGVRDTSFSQILFYNRTPSASEIASLYQFGIPQQNNTALIASVEAPPPPTGGQVIMITSAIPVILILAICLTIGRIKHDPR